MTSRTIVSEIFMLTNFHHVAWEAPPLPDISISKSVAPHTHKRPAHYLSNFRVDFEFVNCHITLHHLNHSREFAAVHLPVQVHVCGHVAPSSKTQIGRSSRTSVGTIDISMLQLLGILGQNTCQWTCYSRPRKHTKEKCPVSPTSLYPPERDEGIDRKNMW